MKKLFAVSLTLVLLLSACALAAPELDTTQFVTPFDFSPDEYKQAADYWVSNIGSEDATRTGWSEPTDIGGGYLLEQYLLNGLMEIYLVQRDDMVYALGLSFPSGTPISSFSEQAVTFGTELGVVIIAAETIGVSDDTLMNYASQLTEMSQSISSTLTDALTSTNESGISSPVLDKMMNSRLIADDASSTLQFDIVYTPEAYSF